MKAISIFSLPSNIDIKYSYNIEIRHIELQNKITNIENNSFKEYKDIKFMIIENNLYLDKYIFVINIINRDIKLLTRNYIYKSTIGNLCTTVKYINETNHINNIIVTDKPYIYYYKQLLNTYFKSLNVLYFNGKTNLSTINKYDLIICTPKYFNKLYLYTFGRIFYDTSIDDYFKLDHFSINCKIFYLITDLINELKKYMINNNVNNLYLQNYFMSINKNDFSIIMYPLGGNIYYNTLHEKMKLYIVYYNYKNSELNNLDDADGLGLLSNEVYINKVLNFKNITDDKLKNKVNDLISSNDPCLICQENILKYKVSLNCLCRATYCYSCIKIWVDSNNTCPLCKSNKQMNDIIYNILIDKDNNKNISFDSTTSLVNKFISMNKPVELIIHSILYNDNIINKQSILFVLSNQICNQFIDVKNDYNNVKISLNSTNYSAVEQTTVLTTFYMLTTYLFIDHFDIIFIYLPYDKLELVIEYLYKIKNRGIFNPIIYIYYELSKIDNIKNNLIKKYNNIICIS